MPESGSFRLRYIVERQKLEAELRRVEASIRAHGRKIGQGAGLGLPPDWTEKQRRSYSAVTTRMREHRMETQRTDRQQQRLQTTQQGLRRETVMGTQAYRNFGHALRRVALWAGAGAAIYGFGRLIRTMADTVAQFQYFRRELEALGTEGAVVYNQLAVSAIQSAGATGRSWEEAAEITKGWIRQGRSAVETADLLRTTLVGMNLTNLDSSQIVKTLTAQLKAFDIEASDSITIIDRLYGVSRKHAIEAQQAAEGLRRFASAARETGLSIDEAYGILVGTLAKTQQSAQMTGTAMRTILTRIFKPAAIDVIQTLAEIPVYMDKSATSFRSAFDILDDLARKWDELNQVDRIFIAQTVAGIRRFDQFAAAMQNWDEVLGATIDSMASAGVALRAQDILMDSQRKAVAQLIAVWNELLATRGGFLDFLTAVTRGLTLLLERILAVSRVIPDFTTGLLAVIALGAGYALGGLAGLGVAGALVVGIEALAIAGTVAGRSLRQLRSEYQQLLRLQSDQAKGTWDLANRYMALAGEADGLTEHQGELSKIQEELKKQLPDLIRGTQTLAETYETLGSNIGMLGEKWRIARESLAEYEVTDARIRMFEARERMRVAEEKLPVSEYAKKEGWWKWTRLQARGLSAAILEAIGKEDWGDALRESMTRTWGRLLDDLKRKGAGEVSDLREEIEKRYMLELDLVGMLIAKEGDLSERGQERLKRHKAMVEFWRAAYKRVLEFEAAIKGVGVAEDYLVLQLKRLEETRRVPERTRPSPEGAIVEALPSWVRRTKAEITTLDEALQSARKGSSDLADSTARVLQMATGATNAWERSGEAIEQSKEVMQILGLYAEAMYNDNIRANVAANETTEAYERARVILERVESKYAEVVERYGEGSEEVQSVARVLDLSKGLIESIEDTSKSWSQTAEKTWGAYERLGDMATDIKSTIAENVILSEAWEHSLAMIEIHGDRFQAQQERIRDLKRAIRGLDEDAVSKLELRRRLAEEENRLVEDRETYRLEMERERADIELTNRLRMIELTEGETAALKEELRYYYDIMATTRSIVEYNEALNQTLRIRGVLQARELKQVDILRALFGLAAGAISGQGAGGWITGAAAVLASAVEGAAGAYVTGIGMVMGAIADRLTESQDDMSDSLDLNTSAIDRNTQTLQNVLEQMISVPTYFTMPAAISRFGAIPYAQYGGYVERSGVAYVHAGEPIGRVSSVSIHIDGAGGNAKAIAMEVKAILKNDDWVESRRGYNPNVYGID